MQADVRLTAFSHGAGCACKLGPGDLGTVMGMLGPVRMPDEVLVSAETGDDAAAWRIGDGRALIATVDVFTPIVDDAYDWGRIAATNAFSDVYAMGGTPVMALNVAGWPVDDLPLDLLARVLQGGQEVAADAGAVVVGGHTITATEPIYGMVALGFADADRLVRNSTAAPGERLFLTKPIGTGLIATAIKRGSATAEQAEAAVRTMTTLNAAAAGAMVEAGAAAGTDVTGFGLLGHLRARRRRRASRRSRACSLSMIAAVADDADAARRSPCAAIGATKPAAGVIATRPATAPGARARGPSPCPCASHSIERSSRPRPRRPRCWC